MPVHATAEDLSIASLASKTYLRIEQRQELEQSIKGLEEVINNPRDYPDADIDAIQTQHHKEAQMLADGTPPEYDGATMNKINRLQKDLQASFTHDLPTYTMLERARPTDVDHHVAWEQKHQQDVLAWKTCLLILDRDNNNDYGPNFLSIARVRSDTPPKSDPRKYAQGFDNTKWAEDVESHVLNQLDDETYAEFLELKLLDWSKFTICKKLNWSADQYDMALQRLRSRRDANREEDYTEESRVDVAKLGTEQTVIERMASATATAVGAPQPEVKTNEIETTSQATWPKSECERLGITMAQLCKGSGVPSNNVYKYAKQQNWPATIKAKLQGYLEQVEEKQQEGALSQ